ncbi:MAG TPA: LysR substrate-binding domain-containing protein [Burkholderiales bacterium]|jgi:DNA-binding transcriptional LysR family regulator
MRLNQIRDFLAIVEAGSMRAAGRRLRVSQPALTKSLRQLEDELGAVLLARGVRGARPTELGKAFLARARAVSADLRRAREELAQLGGSRAGELTIGSAPGPALGLLPEALARLRARWPEATLRVLDVTPSEVLPRLRDGSLDFAISASVEPLTAATAECAVERLFLNEAVIVARRGHRLARARRIADLADAEWIKSGYPTDSSALPEKFREAGLPPPRYRVECPSFLMVPELVARSDLLAVVPWQIADREARARRLVRLRIRQALPARPISLYRRADVPQTPIARECAEILRAVARGRRADRPA